jgi:hypothetical protein
MGYARRSSFPSALCLGCRFVAINFKQSNGTQFDYEANSLYMPWLPYNPICWWHISYLESRGISHLMCLKKLLHTFAESTGLRVNYHKSNMIPINMENERRLHFTTTLNRRRGSFPFTYLGLPLQTFYGMFSSHDSESSNKAGWNCWFP